MEPSSESEFHVPFFRRATTISKQGFSITLVTFGSRERLDYQDLHCHCLLDVELGSITAILRRRTLSDKRGVPLDNTSEIRVYENIRRALEWRGWTVAFVS